MRLSCTVRGCRAPLAMRGHAWLCPHGHAFDRARSGYVNLLQPQDSRSQTAGDSAAAVAARARLLAAGIGRGILQEFVRIAATTAVRRTEVDGSGTEVGGPGTEVDQSGTEVGGPGTEVDASGTEVRGPGTEVGLGVVDLGSGTGDVLHTLSQLLPIIGVGIDLSTAAADHAARRFPDLTWVVANVDRRIPLGDGSVQLVLSLHGRRNAQECARVLAPGGHLLVGVPAADDLVELRQAAQGEGRARERTATVVAEHAPLFRLADRWSARERHALGPEALGDLLQSTYRGRARAAARVETLEGLEVTFASEFLLFTAPDVP